MVQCIEPAYGRLLLVYSSTQYQLFNFYKKKHVYHSSESYLATNSDSDSLSDLFRHSSISHILEAS